MAIAVYLIVSFAFSWAIALALHQAGGFAGTGQLAAAYLFAFMFGPAVGGDVGVTGGVAAARRGRADDAQHPPIALLAFYAMFATLTHTLEPTFDLGFDLAFGQRSSAHVEPDQVGNGRTHANEVRRQVENLFVPAVPRDEPHFRIDQRDALVDRLDRDLEQLAAVEEGVRVARRTVALTTPQGEHFPEVAATLADGRVRPRIGARYPLEEAWRAHAACVTGHGRTGHASGKAVIEVR